MDAMKVIGVFGLIGSGKDTVAEYLEQKYGFFHVSYGILVRGLARQLGRTLERDDLIKTQREYVRRYGQNYFGRLAVQKIRDSNEQFCVLSGIRRPEDVEEPRKAFGEDFLLVFVDASPKIRFGRMRSRMREGDPETLEEFLRQEEEEKKAFGFDKVMKYVRFTIKNEGTLEDLNRNVDAFLARNKIA